MPSVKAPRFGKGFFWTLAGLLLLGAIAGLLRFGGALLVAPDPLPAHAEVAVALAGSAAGEEARRAESLRLLQQGLVDHAMLSVGKVPFWGEWVPDLARGYLVDKYGKELAARVSLCEMKVDSTEEEAHALRSCLEERGWRSVVLVTSNYHTRRAKLIWARTLAPADPPFVLTVHGVPDGDFEPGAWWRRRRYAKTWLLEITKLVWSWLGGAGQGPEPESSPVQQ